MAKSIKDEIYSKHIFRERGGEGERVGEKYPCERETSISCTCPNQGLACNPGMCPDRESNQWLLTFQDDTQSTVPCLSGQKQFFSKKNNIPLKIKKMT